MYKARVAELKKVNHIESQTDFLDLTVEIVSYDKEGREGVVHTQKEALPVDSTKKQVKEVVENMLNGFIRDEEQREKNRAEEAVNQHVETLKEDLVGLEFEAQETKE